MLAKYEFHPNGTSCTVSSCEVEQVLISNSFKHIKIPSIRVHSSECLLHNQLLHILKLSLLQLGVCKDHRDEKVHLHVAEPKLNEPSDS